MVDKVEVFGTISFSVNDFRLEEKVRFEAIRGGFKGELTTERYFGGIEFAVSATGETACKCGARLVAEITRHPAFDPEWKFKEGMQPFIVHVLDEDPHSMRVDQKKFTVWAMNKKEAEEKVKKYDKWLEVARVE